MHGRDRTIVVWICRQEDNFIHDAWHSAFPLLLVAELASVVAECFGDELISYRHLQTDKQIGPDQVLGTACCSTQYGQR